MSKIVDQYKYEQKKINHVFHYTSVFRNLQNIIRSGFIPSYCQEEIGNKKYLIPMVSFCNIPITETDKYMRYGKNGIGMSINWAIENGLSPVIYSHDNSAYVKILDYLTFIQLNSSSDNKYFDEEKHLKEHRSLLKNTILDNNLLIKNLGIKILQFLKNWKTKYKGDDIITYQEREWRYSLSYDKIKSIIYEEDLDFKMYLNKEQKPKPHFPNHSLEITKIEHIKYLIVTTNLQVEKLISTLKGKFGKEQTQNALIYGGLKILTADQVRNDF